MEKLLCAIVILAALSRMGFHSREHRIDGWIAFDASVCFRVTLKIKDSGASKSMAEFCGIDLGRMHKTLSSCTCWRPRHA